MDQINLCVIQGEEGTGRLNIVDAPEPIRKYAEPLLKIAKQTELLPKLIVTNIIDSELKNIVTVLEAKHFADIEDNKFELQHITSTPLPTKYSENVTPHTYRAIPEDIANIMLWCLVKIPQGKAVDIETPCRMFHGGFIRIT